MQWQRLDRDSSIRTIELVKSASDIGLFSQTSCEVQRARLPFYDGYDLYKITNYASLPSFSFHYIGNGKFFSYLDGSEEPIQRINAKGVLHLTPGTVLPYLEFFFQNVAYEGEEMRVVANVADMPWLDSLDAASADAVYDNHTPPRVDMDGESGGYKVEADLYESGHLSRAVLSVSSDGRVAVLSRRMIVSTVANMGENELWY